ncbi:MAG: 3'-5' exonuclease [Thermoplasmataceae archaeon]
MSRYESLLKFVGKEVPASSVLSIDLETLIRKDGGFLTGERIIAFSCSYGLPEVKTEVFIAEDDSGQEEMRILKEADNLVRSIDPSVIIGYNHSGYDIPLIQTKIKKYTYQNKLRALEYYFGTAWCLDMMFVITEDLGKDDGDYHVRKLDDVVNHERYAHLPLTRAKSLVRIGGMTKGEAIEHLWKNDLQSFTEYCIGDTRDLLLIFNEIVYGQ